MGLRDREGQKVAAGTVKMKDPPTIVRAKLFKPLSKMQLIVAELLGAGYTAVTIAAELELSVSTVRLHIGRAAARIPSDLPAQTALTIWARGGTDDVLRGLSLRYEIHSRVAAAQNMEKRARRDRPVASAAS